jgi:aryl-alcohol dehydrogenase-like predicted oxidoreductase
MKYRAMRGSGKRASVLFLGTSWFTSQQEDAAFKMLDDYFEAGGNVLDTGRFYSGGGAEGVITRWLASRNKASVRDKFLIVNKACHHYVDANNVHYPDKNRVKPEFITEDLEYSLERMKQESFDIYLLHRDNPADPVEGLIDRLEQHKREGKIGVYGVSNWSLPRIEQAQAYAKKAGYQGISVNNPSYSLATVKTPRWFGCVYADDAYAAWHKERDIDLVAWAPQASGFFAGRFKDDSPEDIRRTYFNEENIEKLRRCAALASEKGVSSTNIALAYIFNQSMPMMASIGPRDKRELLEAVSALDITLSAQEIDWLSLRSKGDYPNER